MYRIILVFIILLISFSSICTAEELFGFIMYGGGNYKENYQCGLYDHDVVKWRDNKIIHHGKRDEQMCQVFMWPNEFRKRYDTCYLTGMHIYNTSPDSTCEIRHNVSNGKIHSYVFNAVGDVYCTFLCKKNSH